MSVDDLLEEQEDLTNAKPIPYKLQVHIRCFATPSVTVKPAVIKSITQLTETYVIFAFNITTKKIILNGQSAQFGKMVP